MTAVCLLLFAAQREDYHIFFPSFVMTKNPISIKSRFFVQILGEQNIFVFEGFSKIMHNHVSNQQNDLKDSINFRTGVLFSSLPCITFFLW